MMAMSTRCWGAKRRSTSNDDEVGVTSQPLANPSTSTGSPRSSPSAVAVHPTLWLWPRTSQNGSPAVAPGDLDVGAVVVVGRPPRRPAAGRRSVPGGRLLGERAAVRARRRRRPALERRTRRSTSRPASRPSAVSISWSPALRRDRGVAAHPQRERAAGHAGRPSGPSPGPGAARRRSATQVGAAPRVERLGQGGNGLGGQADLGDGRGWSISLSLTQSLVVTGRTPVNRSRKVEPVTACGQRQVDGLDSGLRTRCRRSRAAGTRATTDPSTDTSTSVGTEWRPSATTLSGMLVDGDRLGQVDLDPLPLGLAAHGGPGRGRVAVERGRRRVHVAVEPASWPAPRSPTRRGAGRAASSMT